MTIAALVLEIAYFMLAFVGRSWLQHRRTGDWGLRVAPGAPPAAKLASLLMVVGTAIDFVLPILVLAGVKTYDVSSPVRIVGLAVLVVAIGVVVYAQLTMGASWRVGVEHGEHTALVTHGVFGAVRNPIFAAMAAAAVGLALALAHWLSVVAVGAVVAGVQVQVRRVEEPYLVHQHGDGYRAYLARAGRFVPGVGRVNP